MSLDSSLKSKNSLAGIRSVMKRAERIAKLTEDKKFDAEKNHALGLPKTKPNEK
jgi:small basic protein (TIGR04137 family)